MKSGVVETAVADVREVYRDWAARPIERGCVGRAECCRFRQTGRMPYVTKGEALVAAMAWRVAGRTKVAEAEDGGCPFLKGARCQIYAGRPFGCRTHFCDAAGGPAARTEVRDLIRRLEEIDQRLGGSGGVNFVGAVSRAMGETGRRK